MKIRFFYFLFILTIGCKSNTNSQVTNVQTKNKFYYNSIISPLITVDAIDSNNDSLVMILDNGTHPDYTFIMRNNYIVKKRFIKDSSIASILRFEQSSFRLKFNQFNILSRNNQTIWNMPNSKRKPFSGIIGKGFLKNYIIEINYEENYFVLDSTIKIDTASYKVIPLTTAGFFLYKIPITILSNGKLINTNGLLDLGYEGPGFLFAGNNLKQLNIKPEMIDSLKEVKNTTTTGEPSQQIHFKIDSASLLAHKFFGEIPSIGSISKSGLSGSNIILFGNSFLSRYKRIFIDFRKQKLYVPK